MVPKLKKKKFGKTKFKKDQLMQEGYRTQQATKPQTLSYGMMDSPIGVAAWIIEKFYFWSDIKNNDIESVYSKDTLLANIMVYIVTKNFLILLHGFIMEDEKKEAVFYQKIFVALILLLRQHCFRLKC